MPKDTTTATFSNHERSSRFQESMKNFASTLFESLKTKADVNNEKHKALLEKWESRINGSAILDKTVCDGLIYDISSLIPDEKAAANFRETAFASIGNVDEAIKTDHVKEEDMWKYKALQVLAIATPLGLFSAFNYLEFVANIFGPMLGDAGLATGIAEAGTRVPVLGKIFDKLGGDELFELALGLPIISDVLEVGTAIFQIEEVQIVGGEVAPVAINSEIVMAAAAGAFIVNRLPEDLERDKEKKQVQNIQEGSLGKLQKALVKADEVVDKSKKQNEMRQKIEEQQKKIQQKPKTPEIKDIENQPPSNIQEKPKTAIDPTAAANVQGKYKVPVQQPIQTHAQQHASRLVNDPVDKPIPVR